MKKLLTCLLATSVNLKGGIIAWKGANMPVRKK